MAIFNVDFDRLRQLFTIIAVRGLPQFGMLTDACYKPIVTLYNDLLGFRNSTAQAMRYSSQTCYLRGMLNDYYDPVQRRIRVSNTEQREFVYIYQVAENLPVMVNQNGSGAPLMINRLDAIVYESGFTVYVPADFLTNSQLMNRIRSSVDRYRLATRYYTIKSL